MARPHPREVLLGAAVAAPLPVCDHYCGTELRIAKSLVLQAEMSAEFGACVFDVTLDCEDGAPVGGERDHAVMVLGHLQQVLARSGANVGLVRPRVAVRVHPVSHPAFVQDIDIVVGGAASVLSHVMLPKVETLADVDYAVRLIDALASRSGRQTPMPLHVLIESASAVHQSFAIAAHPRVQSLSFGLMDFVSSHGGAIPATAMRTNVGADAAFLDQFSHPVVARAKLEIASACHAHGKIPSHCVVTEFGDPSALREAAGKASRAFGFTRMWSIHPSQIRPIMEAFAPNSDEIGLAANIILMATKANWAPISHDGTLHDRASYRYFWHVLERAHQTGCVLPAKVRDYFPV